MALPFLDRGFLADTGNASIVPVLPELVLVPG